jgi:cation:H+ antiporter
MSIELSLLLCLVGIVLLYVSAGWLVKGSGSLARSLGIPPLVVGLTVVAFGTSAPELVVSLLSAVKGNTMIAVGNVVGSNICNIALVLGLVALIRPIRCGRVISHRDIPIMVFISLAVLYLCLDGKLTRAEGAGLFGGIVLYSLYNYFIALREKAVGRSSHIEEEVKEIGEVGSRGMQLLLIALGIAGVVVGARLVVDSAIIVMRELEVSEKLVGLTMVAFGTSVPELATSVVAVIKRETDISIGNLVGSNVFNLLSVLGATSLITPIVIPGGFVGSGLVVDFGVMLAVSVLPLLLIRRDYSIGRLGGLVLFLCYLSYVAWLFYRG